MEMATIVFSVFKDKYQEQTNVREQEALGMLYAMGYRAERCDGKFKGQRLPSIAVFNVDLKDRDIIKLLCETFEQKSVLVLTKHGTGVVRDKYTNVIERLGQIVSAPREAESWTKIGDYRFSFSHDKVPASEE